jgi:hypothetical protein
LLRVFSDATGGPRIIPVYRHKTSTTGIGIVETEWTHRSFIFVADVRGPPMGYGYINIVDSTNDGLHLAGGARGEALICSAYLVLDAAFAEGPDAQSVGDDAINEIIRTRNCVYVCRTAKRLSLMAHRDSREHRFGGAIYAKL